MASHANTGKRKHGWDFARAWTRAQARITAAAGVDAVTESNVEVEPVARARRLAEISAPADMRLTLALTHGTSLEELDAGRHAVRVMADMAFRRLAVVGLKSGESVEHDVSDRLKDALGLWFGGDGDRVAPDEPARAERATED